MAKLSGTEVARYVRENKPEHAFVRESRTYLSVRSNGKVLRKHVACIVDIYHPKGYRLHTGGWKVWTRYAQLPTLEELERTFVVVYGYKRIEEKGE